MRIALGLEYDGSSFYGWQSQPGGNTIQDVLESALARIADGPVRVHCAGRTDAGVHALAQIVHFDTRADRPLTAWVRGVNAHLPETVVVRWARVMPDFFHARYSARARSYCYILYNSMVRPALHAKQVGWFHLPLELEAMQRAASALLGEHDFSAFRAAECQARSPVKTLQRSEVTRHGECFVFTFSANAFLHHMVRNVVGALVHVGKGSRPAGWISELLQSRDRARAAPTFAASGLYLAGVDYDDDWRLPERGRTIWPLEISLP